VKVSPKGEIAVPQTAGRGFEVNRERVDKLTVRSERLHAQNKTYGETAGTVKAKV
jgi:O-succinylbenzoate synthase